MRNDPYYRLVMSRPIPRRLADALRSRPRWRRGLPRTPELAHRRNLLRLLDAHPHDPRSLPWRRAVYRFRNPG